MIATTATPTGALGALASLGATPADTDTRATAADAAVQFAALLAAAQRPMGPRGPRVALADLADAGLLPQELAQDLGSMDGEALVEEHPSAPAAFVPMGGAPVIDLSQFPHEHIATFAADDAEATDALDAVADEAREDEDAEAATTTAADPHGRAARTARATAMPAVTDRSTTALDGEFAARLTRVIDRMEAAGHEVEILETTRSSARQDALYAQGRTTEGPVVTWTRDSRHLTGHAADLRVDGKSSGPGYELLQRLAAAEGLRTLGAKDPGHIELPRTTVDAKEGATARRGTDPAAATAPAAPAAVSRLSRLSTVSATSALSSTQGPRTARTTIQAAAQATAAGATPAPATLPADATARATTTGAAARLEYAAGSTVANATRGARGPIARTASPEMRARGVAAALRLVTDSLTEDGTIAPAAARAATTGTADAPAEATVPSEDPQV
ncbi:MAG: M15 family metallopeptidase, partial [Gemmatimonadaceae bacterium]|nr:M15 family metallopeptidase [Gemmatimonadaceae bacterium]